MSTAPNLLDDAGNASLGTALMMSHHGFRRDLRRFAARLGQMADGDTGRLDALRDEWQSFRNTLHGHHTSEDTGIFPHLTEQHPALRPTLESLTADHHRIDPLLERGDRAFGDLPRELGAARDVISKIAALLHTHLATEEVDVVPHMRSMKAFPPPANAEEAEMYAQGFAWASHGIAPEVLDKVYAMLPEILMSRLPAARAAFEARWRRVWGPVEIGAAFTPIPPGG
jgi:hemerythrin-like domain-containing protein